MSVFRFFLSFFVLSLLILTAEAQNGPTYRYHVCSNTTTPMRGSIYQVNLNRLLSNISSATAINGFYNTTSGENPNRIYGLFLCRADVLNTTCQNCVTFATRDVIERCPMEKGAVIWYDECLLRYSNKSIFSTLSESPTVYSTNTGNNTDLAQFIQAVGTTISDAAAQAVSVAIKFATKKANISGFQTLYSLVQCTPDLSSLDCSACLGGAIHQLPTCCSGKLGGQVLNPSCTVRFEVYPFYTESAVAAPPPSAQVLEINPEGASANGFPLSPSPFGKSLLDRKTFAVRNRILIIAPIAVIGIGVLLAFVIIVVYKRIKRMKIFRKVMKSDQDIEAVIRNYATLTPKRYNFSDVKRMTNSYKEKLGRGGYGDVYKGNLPDGRPIAVKVLKGSKGNGEEFINEVASISRTSHVNVVKLLGFCLEGEKRALIYEFMPNGSLEKFIFKEGTSEDNQNLGWEKLYNIAIGIARGLEYLHRGCNTRILHLDIKPQNILLDEEFCPKISDFGLSKLCTRKDSVVSMLGARGTPGYMAPEVFSRNFGAVSLKSDIYSYGMMVLEMVGGKKSFQTGVSASSEYFPDWIYKHLELADELGLQGLKSKVETDTERKMILVGLWCIQTKPSNRPSINKVVEMLEGSVEALQIPPKPFLSSPPRPLLDSSATSGCETISLID